MLAPAMLAMVGAMSACAFCAFCGTASYYDAKRRAMQREPAAE